MLTGVFGVAVLFFSGTVLGSYLNVVAGRFVVELSGKKLKARDLRRSFCPHCHKNLRWWELLPIFSWIFLRGKCARCHHPIAVQYLLVELATGFLVLLIGFNTTLSVQALSMFGFMVMIASLLIILFLIDLKTMYLPDRFVHLLLGVVIIYLFIFDTVSFRSSFYGLIVGSGLLALIWFITKGKGIGMGDVKLLVPLGLFFGLANTLVLLWVAFIGGGVVGAGMLLTKKAGMKTAIPFGPFLIGAAFLLMLWPQITDHMLRWMYVR